MKKFLILILLLAFSACTDSMPLETQLEAQQESQPELHQQAQTQTTPEPIVAFTETPQNHDIISFESGDYGFFARGFEQLSRTSEASHTGEFSLKVTGRNEPWNGIAVNVTEQAVAFEEHAFSMWVMPVDEDTSFVLSAEFIKDGEPFWRNFGGASVTARAGEWSFIGGTLSFYDFDTVNVYIETNLAGKDTDFFIDDVFFSLMAIDYSFDASLPRLCEVFEDYFLVGTAVSRRDLHGTRLEFVRHHFNAITAGNDMKPDALQNRRGIFTFSAADEIVNALDGMSLIGHTLVWHEQSPEWLNREGISPEEALQNMRTHIGEVVTYYKGRLVAWDVVNEAFPSYVPENADHANWRELLRQTPWLAALGSDYIELAFRAAHEADPSARLIYNDYNLDGVGKREAVFYMIQELLEKGVPIHGVGMQAHYSLDTMPSDVEASIERFAELGISVSITELDVVTGALPLSVELSHKMPPELEIAQSELYSSLFEIFKKHADVIDRVTLWGLDDATNWRSWGFPLMFDRQLSAKLGFYGVVGG
ncbi:MAG: endo-1,4-beta-xylanase [Defluviitaleaceae bacterium]|nr:endo-1,4-beta-xylanase [Defluviitaleaceae bacterium]